MLPAIDWQPPWLAALRPLGPSVAAQAEARGSVAEALNAALDQIDPAITLAAGRLRFVAQQRLPRDEAFEAFIARSAQVPTRDNLHDLFSGLVWLTQPALKRRLNALQAEAIRHHGIGPQRGAARDTLTRFDEHGALLQAAPALWQALRARDWQALFVTRRALWATARLQVVGHALLEQLATAPRKPLTAFVWDAGDVLTAPADTWATRPLRPLPVLGVPGWWPANEAAGFYDDTTVFRPPKPFFALARARPVD